MIKNNSLRKGILLIVSSFSLFWACTQQTDTPENNQFSEKLSQQYHQDVKACILLVQQLKAQTQVDSIKASFIQARLAFKKLEPILSFHKEETYEALNQANLPIVHEDNNGLMNEDPHGFQVLEEALFDENPNMEVVNTEIHSILTTLELEEKTIDFSRFKKHHFMWMLRKEFVRVMALGITGFDSPMLKNSTVENKAVFESLKQYMSLYEDEFTNPQLYTDWMKALDASSVYLGSAKSFEEFDRYHFIKNHLHPFLKLWKRQVADWKVEFPFNTKMLYDTETFFGTKTFNIDAFKPSYAPKFQDEIAALGKTLFYEEKLSGSGNMSCATCHEPKRFFTDGLKRSMGNDGKPVQRNSPTIFYAALQGSQFHDARAGSLEEQIKGVVENEKEFHTSMEAIVDFVNTQDKLKEQFNKLYKDGVTERNVRNAIATFERSFIPFKSKFDQNISGLANTLTANEINGFNLFMGKAECATCHFAPIFNGTVPPFFTESELEVLGTPSEPVFENATIDPDLGRFDVFGAELRKFAFKTPTVRNVARTAPYMHNGVYQTLEDVVEFYNKGGGAGMEKN